MQVVEKMPAGPKDPVQLIPCSTRKTWKRTLSIALNETTLSTKSFASTTPFHPPNGYLLPPSPISSTTGAVPRICNKAKLKPMDLEDPKNKELRNALQKANDPTGRDDVVLGDAPDKGPTGSASDSD